MFSHAAPGRDIPRRVSPTPSQRLTATEAGCGHFFVNV